MNNFKTTVGLLGCGHVGAGVAKMLLVDRNFIREKMGWPLELLKIAVRNPAASRPFDFPVDLFTTDPYEIVGNKDIQVVVELIGGIELTRELVLAALRSGQHVVTANKALLAHHGREIFAVAAKNKVEVMFEAAVAGGIPIIRVMKEGLSANRIRHLFGILNGTSNYILTRMSREGLDFKTALEEAQQIGYAESDPTLDVEGQDAAHKLILLTALAYGTLPDLNNIHIEGITALTPEDIEFARELGYVVKLLAISARDETDGRLEVRLHPAMLPKTHLLAEVCGSTNAVLVSGHAVGDILLNGAGAGMMPTASSVLGDLMEVARTSRQGSAPRVPSLGWFTLNGEIPRSMSETRTTYYLRFTVADRPGVLAAIASLFAEYGISLAQVIQKSAVDSHSVPLVILTHLAQERDLKAALKVVDKLPAVTAPTRLIRVETRL